jgi:hypothetical protein
MIVTNTKTSAAYKGTGVVVTIDKSVQNDAECISWFYPGMQVTSDASGAKGVIAWVDRKGSTFCVMPEQTTGKFNGSSNFKLKPADTISFDEIRVGSFIFKEGLCELTEFNDQTPIPQKALTADWISATGPAWCYQNNDPLIPGKLYNYYCVNSKFAPIGWRIISAVDMYKLSEELGDGMVTAPSGTKAGYACGKLKSTTGWATPNLYAQNYKNFNAKPNIIRRPDNGIFSPVNSISSSVFLTKSYIINFNTGRKSANYVGVSYWGFRTGSAAYYFQNTFGPYEGFVPGANLNRYGLPIKLVRDYQPYAGIS